MAPTSIFRSNARKKDVAAVRDSINAVLASAGSGYSCKNVSWDDVSRGNVNGSLSCWGGNITDTYLKAKDGTPLFTVRSDNWNEKLGVVSAEDVALLTGNCDKGELRNVTLRDFLAEPHKMGGGYTGMDEGIRLLSVEGDKKVSIRFQTVFLPVEQGHDYRGRIEFATEAYNYQTQSDDNPKNLVLLATTQGLSVQADGSGTKRLLLHAKEKEQVNEYWLEAESSGHEVGGEQKETKEERDDAIKRGKATSEIIGIKAMGTRFNVLMTVQIPLHQTQSYGTRSFGSVVAAPNTFGLFGAAPAGGCSFAGKKIHFGVGGFGEGNAESDCLQPIPSGAAPFSSIPPLSGFERGVSFSFSPPAPSFWKPPTTVGVFGPSSTESCMFAGQEISLTNTKIGGGCFGVGNIQSNSFGSVPSSAPFPYNVPPVPSFSTAASAYPSPLAPIGGSTLGQGFGCGQNFSSGFGQLYTSGFQRPKEGRARAARVSRGELYGPYKEIGAKAPKRKSDEHVTVTCVIYNAVIGGVPNAVDVLAAVADMEKLYAECSETGRLADAAFMKSELTVSDMVQIEKDISTQAPVAAYPPVIAVMTPSTETKKDIVERKLNEFAALEPLTESNALELKLLSIGAYSDDSGVHELLKMKFDSLVQLVKERRHTHVRALLSELKLIIKGANCML